MVYERGTVRLEPGEEVIYATEPNMQGFWMMIGCGAIIGLFFLLLPGLIILLMGFIQREKFKNAECLVTNQRIIVIGWGGNRRMVQFEHHEVASITRSGTFSKSVTIRGHDGRRAKLSYVQYDWEFVTTAQEAIEASRASQP